MRKHFLRGLVALPLAACILVGPAYAAGPTPQRQIFARDVCDPVTFNQAIGAGTCTRPGGGLPFQQFISQLTRLESVPAWRFTPDTVVLSPGQPFVTTNAGGEAHTFTEVAQFGGGFVPQLNQLSGNLSPALLDNGQPACTPSNPELNFIAPGQSTAADSEDSGVHMYQCCIHPWMRAVLRVR